MLVKLMIINLDGKMILRLVKSKFLVKLIFNILSVTKGMTIIQEDEYNKAVICVTAMKNDRYIKKYFVKSDTIESIDQIYYTI